MTSTTTPGPILPSLKRSPILRDLTLIWPTTLWCPQVRLGMWNRLMPMGCTLTGPANSFNVFIYSDNGGLPGTQVYSTTDQPWLQSGTTFTVTLSPVAVLSP